MSSSLCRWGILGTASIAHKNWQAIRYAENSVLVAVASRDLARARRFIEECQAAAPLPAAPVPCGGYQELLDRKDIDAVYIPLPTAVRKEWVLRAAEAGKHVLCEKPCGVASEDVREMLEACRRHHVQFMDGVMFMHSQRLPLLRQALHPKVIGAIRRISSEFDFLAPDEFYTKDIRTSSDLEPLGSLGDLGWYNIRFALWVMNEQLPERASGRILAEYQRNEKQRPVPVEFSGELFFPGETSASFFCSFKAENQQWAMVSGTKGFCYLRDFVLPFFSSEVSFEVSNPAFLVRGCDFIMEDHIRRWGVNEYSNSAPNAQETNMIRTFARIVTSGQLESGWGDQALKTQQVLDACLRSARQDGQAVAI